MSAWYPVFLDLCHKRVLIAGGGQLALQKLHSLESADADVTVVAPELRGDWLGESGKFQWVRRGYRTEDLAGASLVFAATDDAALNHRVVAESRELGIPANAVDDTDWCDFYTPAIVRRGRVTFALSTDGGFPGVTRALRETLDAWLPPGDDGLMDALFALRQAVRRSEASPAKRTAALRALIAEFKVRYLNPPHGSEVLPASPDEPATLCAALTTPRSGHPRLENANPSMADR